MAKEISALTATKRAHIENVQFQDVSNREVLETIRAHFESHPTMPGEKQFKKRVNELLENPEALEDWDPMERERMIIQYAETEVRETKFVGNVVDMTKNGTKQYKEPEENKFQLEHLGMVPYPERSVDAELYSLDVELRKVKDGVNIYAKTNQDAARFTKVGTVPDNFLTNNPMNVNRCPAQISIEDFSGGKLRNVSERLVVESSRMSGDYVELDNDMLSGLDKTTGLEQ